MADMMSLFQKAVNSFDFIRGERRKIVASQLRFSCEQTKRHTKITFQKTAGRTFNVVTDVFWFSYHGVQRRYFSQNNSNWNVSDVLHFIEKSAFPPKKTLRLSLIPTGFPEELGVKPFPVYFFKSILVSADQMFPLLLPTSVALGDIPFNDTS